MKKYLYLLLLVLIPLVVVLSFLFWELPALFLLPVFIALPNLWRAYKRPELATDKFNRGVIFIFVAIGLGLLSIMIFKWIDINVEEDMYPILFTSIPLFVIALIFLYVGAGRIFSLKRVEVDVDEQKQVESSAVKVGVGYFKNTLVILFVVVVALFAIFILMVGPASGPLTGATYDWLKCGASKGGSTEDYEGVNCKCFGVMTSKYYEDSKVEKSCFGICSDCTYPHDYELENHFPEYLEDVSKVLTD